MDHESIKKIYHSYSNIYDFLFKSIFLPRQRQAINSLEIMPNEKILDVGVGTGLSLSCYPSHCEVVGIDLSRSMLKKAHEKKEKQDLNHVKLFEMDACNLEFEDNTFDHVVATFVITVVPDPVKAVLEMKRVCKPGRPIVILNHFRSGSKFVAKIEEFFDPLCRRIGWRNAVALDELARDAGLDVTSSRRMKKFDPWTIVFAKNTK